VKENDSCEWKKRADRNGRYFDVEARGDYRTTLRDALVEPFDTIIQSDRVIDLNVWPYRRNLTLADFWIIEDPVTVTLISPDGDKHLPESVNDDSYNVSVPRPDEGRWLLDIDVGRNGAVDVSRIETQFDMANDLFDALDLVLRREDYTKQLQQGQPLLVRFSIRDDEYPSIPLIDERFKFTGRLELEEIRETVHSVVIQPVHEEGYDGYYEAKLKNTKSLQGPYRLIIEGGHEIARDIEFSEDWPVYFGLVPGLEHKLSTSAKDLKVKQSFSVTVKPENLDIVASPIELNLHLSRDGYSEESIRMEKGEAGVYAAEVPGLSEAGMYTLTAVLEGGVTSRGVKFDETRSPETVIRVRNLRFWERYGAAVRISSSVLLSVLILRFGYPLIFRIATGWVNDFDVVGDLLR
jgi:hypothetical protein